VIDGEQRWAIDQALIHLLDGLDPFACGESEDGPLRIGGFRHGKLVAAVAPLRRQGQ
jgi:hypothetical protein